MLRKYLCLLLSLTLLFENARLLASPRKKTIQDYKEGVYKIFSPVKHLKDKKDKRAYLETVLNEINKKFEQEDTRSLSEKDLESFEKIKNQFKKWETHLPQVSDQDLDKFAKAIIQETEQAFIVGLIIGSIVLAMIIVIIVTCHLHLKGRGGVVLHAPRGPRWGVRVGPRWGFRRGPRFHAHCHVGMGPRGRRC